MLGRHARARRTLVALPHVRAPCVQKLWRCSAPPRGAAPAPTLCGVCVPSPALLPVAHSCALCAPRPFVPAVPLWMSVHVRVSCGASLCVWGGGCFARCLPQVVALFEQDYEGDINFKQFLKTLSPFRASASVAQKLNCGCLLRRWHCGLLLLPCCRCPCCPHWVASTRARARPGRSRLVDVAVAVAVVVVVVVVTQLTFPTPCTPAQAFSPCLTLTATASFPTRTLCC